MENNKNACVVYCRFSSALQNEISLEAQEASCRTYAAHHGFSDITVVVDRISGACADRPGLNAVLGLVEEKKIGAVIVFKLDRFARSTVICLNTIDRFTKNGVKFISVAEDIDFSTPMGRMMLTMLSCVSEMERSNISSRTSMIKQHRKAQGLVYGKPCFGWKNFEGHVVKDEQEQGVVAIIRKLNSADVSSNRIARLLNEKNIRARNGRWFPQSVANVLKAA